jgi:hypothetical protein
MSTPVVDIYASGKSRLQGRKMSLFTAVVADPELEMNKGELLRYLAESVWFPTALLPGEEVM